MPDIERAATQLGESYQAGTDLITAKLPEYQERFTVLLNDTTARNEPLWRLFFVDSGLADVMQFEEFYILTVDIMGNVPTQNRDNIYQDALAGLLAVAGLQARVDVGLLAEGLQIADTAYSQLRSNLKGASRADMKRLTVTKPQDAKTEATKKTEAPNAG